MTSLLLLTASWLAALVIFKCGLFFALNNMTRCTSPGIRLAWICLTAGAFGVLIAPLFGEWRPTLAEALLLMGMATFLQVERRRRVEWCRW